MNKSIRKQRRSKRRSKRIPSKCKEYLSKKIAINIREGIYASNAQAIAVAYSQVSKKHPSCKRVLRKKSKRSPKSSPKKY
jgi:hypothetical protein